MSQSGPALFAAGNAALGEALAALGKSDTAVAGSLAGEMCSRLAKRTSSNADALNSESSNYAAGVGLFLQAEVLRLKGTLGVSDEAAVGQILAAVLFTIEQTAYFDLSPQQLEGQLIGAGLPAPNAKSFASAWEENRSEVLLAFRSQSVAPRTLESVGWRLQLQVAQSAMSRLKEPTAIFELGLASKASQHDNKQAHLRAQQKESVSTITAGKVNCDDKLLLEFNHSELAHFFQQLEVIQEQLDRVG